MNRQLVSTVLLLAIFLIGIQTCFGQQQLEQVGCQSEWQPAKVALVHTPGEELFYGVIHPEAALFERAFSASAARREHLDYVEDLKRRSVDVVQLKDAVLHGTVDNDGIVIEGPKLAGLQKFAFQFVEIDSSQLVSKELRDQSREQYFSETFCKLHPEELWKTIVLNPKVTLRSTGELNTGLVASYEVRPVMNLYFMRDQIITTAKGVVVGRMNSEQRRIETDIVKFALKNLEIKPIAEVENPGRLEGGDFLPAGERVFIGQGLRTNAAAIGQLLEADAFGTDEVVVVKDPWKQQEQMHVDTYFNIISSSHAVLAENRLTGQTQAPQVDVYAKGDDGYSLRESGTDFQNYLERNGWTVIEVSQADQLNYGCNFLTVRENEVFLVDGVSKELVSNFEAANVKVNLVDFANLTGGYGACHCTVQVLKRE